MPVILASQEPEIRRITVQSQPRQIVHETHQKKKTPKPKNITTKSWWSDSKYRP
jgi:hypothetical protein